MPNLKYTIPLLVLLAFIGAMAAITMRAPSPAMKMNSTLSHLPDFSLPAVKGFEALAAKNIRGDTTLINFFASWCSACRLEHAQLMALADRMDITIIGIAWRDDPAKTGEWLKNHGNPYRQVAQDTQSLAAIALGISGVPESFLVDSQGTIIAHIAGPITKDILHEQILPYLR